VPRELTAISAGADRIFSSRLATAAQWRKAEKVARGMIDAWDGFRAGDVPPRLVRPTRAVSMSTGLQRSASRSLRHTSNPFPSGNITSSTIAS
jgi:hypothetical protein